MDVSTAGKYDLAVGPVLLPIEVPLLTSAHVSIVIPILVNDTSGMTATSGTNECPGDPSWTPTTDKTEASMLPIWSPMTGLHYVEFIVSVDIVPLCVILIESHAYVE